MGSLGTGDQMLARIAATLLDDPDGTPPWAYVMDEPTAALTGAESARLFAAIATLRSAGAAILYVSHRMDEVMALADRITVLRDGAHVATRDRAATHRDEVIRDMTGRDLADLFPRSDRPTGAPSCRCATSAPPGSARSPSISRRARCWASQASPAPDVGRCCAR